MISRIGRAAAPEAPVRRPGACRLARAVALALFAVAAGPVGPVAASSRSRQLVQEARELAHGSPARPVDALEALARAVKADPDDEEARFFLAYVALQVDRPRAALDALGVLERRGIRRPHHHYLKGRALAALGRHDEAVRAYDAETHRSDNPYVDEQRALSLRALDRRAPRPEARTVAALASPASPGDASLSVVLDAGPSRPPPRLQVSVANRLEYDDRESIASTGRNVATLDVDYALTRTPSGQAGAVVSSSYLAGFDDGTASSWVNRGGLRGETTRGSWTVGGELEASAVKLDDPALDSTGATARGWVATSAWDGHWPQIGYEITRRDMKLTPEFTPEDRDATIHAVSLSDAWIARRRRDGPLELRLTLSAAREDTTGGFYDLTFGSGQIVGSMFLALWPRTPANLEIGGSLDRTRYASELHTAAVGGERSDRTAAGWIRLRQPLANGRTSVDVQYTRSRATSTIEGLGFVGQLASVGLQHVF
jgi:hypothetical protein